MATATAAEKAAQEKTAAEAQATADKAAAAAGSAPEGGAFPAPTTARVVGTATVVAWPAASILLKSGEWVTVQQGALVPADAADGQAEQLVTFGGATVVPLFETV